MTALPSHMDVMAIEPQGKGQGCLIPAQHALPVPAPHEILIKISHAGINRADILQRKGLYPAPQGASPLPGLEASGVVAAVGAEVTEWQVDDRVCALLAGGGYAQYATAHAEHCLPVPQGWSMEEAAAFPEAAFTVWMALGAEAKLLPHERFLVHGGASGIGMMAIQYAAALGVTVFVTASSAEKCAQCRAWGAAHSINYTEQDFVETIATATNGAGVEVILDYIGGDYVQRNFAALATEGRMVSLAFLRGAKVEGLNLAPLLHKRLLWKGTTLRARSDGQKAEYARAIRSHMWPFVEQGKIRPHIDRVFSLADAQKAHETMEQNLNIGKIVLQV